MKSNVFNRAIMAFAFCALLTGMSASTSAQRNRNEQRRRDNQAQRQQNRDQQQVVLARRQQVLQLQQQRQTQYRQQFSQQRYLVTQRAAQLQQQRRMAQYRYQQQYQTRYNQMRLQSTRNYNTAYLYAAPSYRYSRNGNNYETNQYGANLLRQAVNYGYEQGFRSAQADKQDRWQSNYQDSPAYQDANYGYGGYYVDQADYNHYFREGFRRGYEDGYDGRSQYGSYSGGTYSILGNVLSAILNLQSFQ